MGTAYGIYPCGSALVMGKIDGETFLGRLLIFFFGGAGEGKRNSRARNAETFSQDDASSEHPCVYVIYYMLSSGGFTVACLQAIAKGVLDPRLPWADTCAPQASTTRRPSSRIEDGEGAVAPRSTMNEFQYESRNGKKTPSSYGDGGTQPKLGLPRKNPPSSADFYHLQLPQM